MKVGDLVTYRTGTAKWMTKGKKGQVGIIVAIEEDYKYSRFSERRTRPVKEAVVLFPDGSLVKWYSEHVEVIGQDKKC